MAKRLLIVHSDSEADRSFRRRMYVASESAGSSEGVGWQATFTRGAKARHAQDGGVGKKQSEKRRQQALDKSARKEAKRAAPKANMQEVTVEIELMPLQGDISSIEDMDSMDSGLDADFWEPEHAVDVGSSPSHQRAAGEDAPRAGESLVAGA